MKNRVVEIDDNVDLSKAALIRGTWHINRNTNGHIDGVKTKIQINKVRKQIWLHNLIFEKSNPEKKNVVDHIDHNTLNNLREVSKEQNAQKKMFLLL